VKFSSSLKSSYEFRRLYSKGASAVSPLIVVYCRKNKKDCNRLGITVGVKIGKAVQRNRIRRRLREIYRLNEEKFSSGWDIVVVARVKCRYAEYRRIEADLLRLSGKLGLLK
jgi:ribonuclease P protein component